jgi:ubiquinone/menaquinone biosynthesis C-methylase UbiE
MSNVKVELGMRRVLKVTGKYVVIELQEGGWTDVSKYYDHSTSAFAALGKLYQKELDAAGIKPSES